MASRLLTQIDSAAPGAAVSVTNGDDRLRLGLERVEPLAVSFSELRLATDRLADASVDRVREVAQRLTRRVTYLLEPLTPVEIDRELAVVQMRSVDPPRDGEGSTYYELLVKRGGSLSLRRYRKPRGSLREPIDATVTREVLGRLADDFLASVSE